MTPRPAATQLPLVPDVLPTNGDTPAPSVQRARKVGVDPASYALSATSLALLVAGGVGYLDNRSAVGTVALLLYAVVGFGSAALVVCRRNGPRRPLRSRRTLGRAHSARRLRDRELATTETTTTLPSVSFAVPVGIAINILAGFTLIETHIWTVGPYAFLALVTISCTIHSIVLLQAVRSLGPTGLRTLIRYIAAGSLLRIKNRPRLFATSACVVGLGLCLLTSWSVTGSDPNRPLGFFKLVSPIWYIGLATLLASALVALYNAKTSLGMPIVALCLALTLSPSIIYPDAAVPWAAKHVGVTLYIMSHGTVHFGLNIYQSWNGLFAGTGWLCHVVGLSDPMSIARWWPPIVDLATLLVFQRLALRFLGNERRSWLAAGFLVLGNTIGQDYYSPQSVGFLLAIAIFAVGYKAHADRRGLAAGEWAIVLTFSCSLAVTHELSPYLTTGVLLVLVVFGLCRSRLLPAVVLIPAVAWTAANFHIVERYLKPTQIGSLATNILPGGLIRTSLHKGTLIRVDSYAMAGAVTVVGILAVGALVRYRTRTHMAGALCALSGLGLFFGSAYGNEGIFRVALFALPWLALLAADLSRAEPGRRLWAMGLAVLPGMLVMNLIANRGLDYIRVIRPGDLTALRAFETTAPPKSRLFILGYNYAPVKSTAEYNDGLVKEHGYPDLVNPPGEPFSATKSYGAFLNMLVGTHLSNKRHETYFLSAEESMAGMVELHLGTVGEYRAFVGEVERSPNWSVVARNQTAELFKLQWMVVNTSPPSVSIPLGSLNKGQRVLAVGTDLTALPGTWESVNKGRYTYQWLQCNRSGTNCVSIAGAHFKQYRVHSGDEGHTLAVDVSFVDSQGHAVTGRSAAIPLVPLPPIVEIKAPSIVGTARIGTKVGLERGVWTAGPDKLAYSYQWELCSATGGQCEPIQGAVSQKLKLDRSEYGHTLSVVVSVKDPNGETVSTTAHDTTLVSAPPRRK